MEIKVYQDTVTAGQVICDTKQELSVEAEILIPDYLPQVFKIVKCFVACVVLQKQFSAGRLTVEGYLRCVVLYQSEEAASLCRAEHKLPFTKQVELSGENTGAAHAWVSGQTEYVNCRAVSGRRVDVRGAFLMNILALCAAQQPVLTALSGDGVEQKTQALQHVEFLCAPEKLCTAQCQVPFAETPDMVLDTPCAVAVEEVKLTEGKAVVKGSARMTVLYRTGPGHAIQQVECEAPFNEVLDAPGADEACRACVSVQPAGCTIAQSEEEGGEAGGYELSATLAMCVRVFRQEETLAVCDAFSTLQNTVLAKRDVVLDEMFVPCEQAVTATTGGELPDPQAKIITAMATALPPEVLEEDGKATLRGRAMVHLLCENAVGEVDCYDKACEYSLPLPQASGGVTALCEAQVERVSAQTIGSETKADVALTVRGALLCRAHHTLLENVEAAGPREETASDIALRIYFAHEGEEVFDIARRYATSPQSIVQANALDDDVRLDAARRLLIPCAR